MMCFERLQEIIQQEPKKQNKNQRFGVILHVKRQLPLVMDKNVSYQKEEIWKMQIIEK